MNEYKIGDIANGHILTENGWIPAPPTPAAPVPPKKKRTGLKIAGGVFGVLLLIGILSPSDSTEPAASPTPEPVASAPAEVEETEEEVVVEEEEEAPTYTAEEAWAEMPSEEKDEICDSSDLRGDFNSAAFIWTDLEETPTFTKAEIKDAMGDYCPKPLSKSDHKTVGERDLAKIVKSPDKHIGENIIVYAEVSQFDGATGEDTFRGYVANRNITEYGYWIGGDNSVFLGTEKQLSDVVEDDIVKVWVTVAGGLTYDTQIGGSTTVPQFIVNFITVI